MKSYKKNDKNINSSRILRRYNILPVSMYNKASKQQLLLLGQAGHKDEISWRRRKKRHITPHLLQTCEKCF